MPLSRSAPASQLITQLTATPAGQPAGQALTLMAHSAISAAAFRLVAALGGFGRGLHAHLDPALLGAAVAIAVRFIQQPQADAPLTAAFAFGLLSVPALTHRLAAPSVERLKRGDAVWGRCTEHGPALAAQAPQVLAAEPDAALCLAGNLLSLGFGGRTAAADARQVVGATRLLQALLLLAGPGAGGGGSSSFHQLRGWSAASPSAALRPHLDAMQAQLLLLWSPAALRLLYTEELCVAVGTSPPDAKLAALGVGEVQHLTARAQVAAAAHTAALRALAPLRPFALARLSYSSHLVPCLWSLLRRLPSVPGTRSGAGASGVLARLLGGLSQLQEEPLLPLLTLLLEGVAHLLPVLDDHELFSEQHPFTPHDLAELSSFLNELAFTLTWDSPPPPATPRGSAAEAQKGLREAALRLLTLLTDRDSRRAFCPPAAWLVGRLSPAQLRRELTDKKPRAKMLLSSMPWTVPLNDRVGIFRELVRQEKDVLGKVVRRVAALELLLRLARVDALEDAEAAEVLEGDLQTAQGERFGWGWMCARSRASCAALMLAGGDGTTPAGG